MNYIFDVLHQHFPSFGVVKKTFDWMLILHRIGLLLLGFILGGAVVCFWKI